jgi:hypothetical protein
MIVPPILDDSMTFFEKLLLLAQNFFSHTIFSNNYMKIGEMVMQL